MAGQRSYTFRIILIYAAILVFGFGVGFLGANFFLAKKSERLSIGANNIMAKRMRAIKEARKKGSREYEFEVLGFHPILNK